MPEVKKNAAGDRKTDKSTNTKEQKGDQAVALEKVVDRSGSPKQVGLKKADVDKHSLEHRLQGG